MSETDIFVKKWLDENTDIKSNPALARRQAEILFELCAEHTENWTQATNQQLMRTREQDRQEERIKIAYLTVKMMLLTPKYRDEALLRLAPP